MCFQHPYAGKRLILKSTPPVLTSVFIVHCRLQGGMGDIRVTVPVGIFSLANFVLK